MRIKPKSTATAVDASAAAGGEPPMAAAGLSEAWMPEKKDAPTQQQQASTTTTTTTAAAAVVVAGTGTGTSAVANAPAPTPVRPLRELLGCQDKSNRRRIAQRGDYWVLYNYVPARRWYRCDESITYTTHADFTFLDNLEPLLDR